MLRRLYNWTIHIAGHRHALRWMFGIAFIESSVFPIPPDVLLIPMVLARRSQAFLVAFLATAGSVLGAFLGYAIGHFLFHTIGQTILDFYGATADFNRLRELYDHWGWWIIPVAGMTPFPFKVITIASGVFGLDLTTFALACTVSRGGRFFIESALLWRFGPRMRNFIERNLNVAAVILFVLLLVGLALVRGVLKS